MHIRVVALIAVWTFSCTEEDPSYVYVPPPPRGDPAGDSTAGDSAGDPTSGDPVAGDPVAGDPVAGDPVAGDPVAGDPVAGDPGPAGGSIDPTLGLVGVPFTDAHGYAHAVAIQNNGAIVVAGYAALGGNDDIVVNRHLDDGTLDASFGTGGQVVHDFGAGNDQIRAVALQSDQKVIVVGRAHNGTDTDLMVSRFTTAGVLDATFATAGSLILDSGNGNDYAYAVVVLADDAILVCGRVENPTNTDFVLLKTTAAGVLDTTFGSGGGVMVTDFGGQSDTCNGLAVQSDNRIVAVGSTHNGTDTDFGLARYTAAGVLDPTFSGDGIQATDLGAANYLQDVVLLGNGQILVSGGVNNGGNYDFALARYTSAGEIDTTFGTSGVTTLDMDGGIDGGYSLLAMANGAIMVIGRSDHGAAGADFGLARFTSAGALDTSFGVDGKVFTDFGLNDGDIPWDAVFDLQGRIVVAGQVRHTGSRSNMGLVRYLP